MKAKATATIRSTETRLFNGAGCPTEWLWDRVDEATETTRQPKAWFVRGTKAHEYIEDVLNGIPEAAAWDSLHEWFESSPLMEEDWMETTKCTKAGLYTELTSVLEKWGQQYEELYQDLTPVAIEYELNFTTPNGTVVSTTLDALFRDEQGHPVVVDWKFGTSKSGLDMQLYVYWYGLRKLGLIPEDAYFRGWFHYITYEKPLGYTASTEYPGDHFVETYIDTAEERRRSGPYLPNPTWFSCRYCYHKEVCPLFVEDAVETWEMINEIKVEFNG